jgi:hypothetical protein
MSWRPARSIQAAIDQADQLAPHRSHVSDGTIGDASHQKNPSSDHNPDGRGVVHAHDFTHDLAHGFNCHVLAEGLRQRRDPRIRYVIFNRRIFKGPGSDGVMAGRRKPWVWEPYTGPNAHKTHLHLSVGYAADAENDVSPWWEEDDMPDEKTFKQWVREVVDEELDRRLKGGVIHGQTNIGGTLAAIADRQNKLADEVAKLPH